MPKSIGLPPAGKPKKPRPDFPLFPHASDRWAKKVRGKLHYFGKVSTDTKGEAALARWLEQKDALLAGRTPKKRTGNQLTLEDLCDAFLTAKELLKNSNELSPRTFAEYYGACGRLLDHFGKERIVDAEEIEPEDFGKYRAKLAETRGPVALGNELIRVRMVFKFAYDERLIPAPLHFGQQFSKPKKKSYLQAKAENGPKMFSAEEVRAILAATNDNASILHAQILLGINAAFGQNDISEIPKTAFDLKAGWVRFPRPKTGVPRRAKLWPETVAALKVAFDHRSKPKDPADERRAFLAPNGKPIVRHFEEGLDVEEGQKESSLWKTRTDYLGRTFKLRLRQLGIDGRRGFYGLRHTFQTIADNKCRDEAAVKHVMGHTDDTISAGYRDHFEDARLEAVANAVRDWLFGSSTQGTGTDSSASSTV